jgi:tripartite-type tricarboxylate transporter receptor subunit TctC
VTDPTRTPATPDIPAVAETYPGFDVSAWLGFQAPASKPMAIIDRLNKNILKVMAMQDVRERLINLGADRVSSTPEQFYQHIAREEQK